MVVEDLVADPENIAPAVRRLLSLGRRDSVRHVPRLVSDLAGRKEGVGVEDGHLDVLGVEGDEPWFDRREDPIQ